VNVAENEKRWSDERLEAMIGNLLRAGLMLASVVVLAGAALYLARHGGAHPSYHIFRGEPAELRGLGGILAAAGSLHGRALIQLGLLLLLATPVARVAFSLVAFALQRDRLYVGVTATVLAVLLYSLVGSPR
jgi:uncharacterized membrane protein